MANNFEFGGVQVAVPYTYDAVFATTSTDDSDRTMDLVMHNTPIGTITGYDFEWKDITLQEAATIMRQVLNKPEFLVHYLDLYYGTWRDAYFYASNFNAGAKTLEDGFEKWSGLSFGIRSINPT